MSASHGDPGDYRIPRPVTITTEVIYYHRARPEGYTVTTETFEEAGRTYERHYDNFIDRDPKHFMCTEKDGEVRCGQCQNPSFWITFGSYEVRATCTMCQFSAIIYEG